MCSGSEAGSYLRLMDFVYHSILGLRVIKKKNRNLEELVEEDGEHDVDQQDHRFRGGLVFKAHRLCV